MTELYATFDGLVATLRKYVQRADSELEANIPIFIGLAEKKLSRLPKHLGFQRVVVGAFTPGSNVLDKPNRWRSTVSINFGSGSGKVPVSRAAASGVRTLAFDEPHGFEISESVTVSAIGGTGYNGTVTITDITPLTIVYTNGSATEATTADTTGFVTTAQNSASFLKPKAREYCQTYWPDASLTGTPLFYGNYDFNHWIVTPTPDRAYPIEIVYYEQPDPLTELNQQNWFSLYAPDALLYGALLEMAPYLKNDDRIPTWEKLYMTSVNGIQGEAIENLDDGTTSRAGAA